MILKKLYFSLVKEKVRKSCRRNENGKNKRLKNDDFCHFRFDVLASFIFISEKKNISLISGRRLK